MIPNLESEKEYIGTACLKQQGHDAEQHKRRTNYQKWTQRDSNRRKSNNTNNSEMNQMNKMDIEKGCLKQGGFKATFLSQKVALNKQALKQPLSALSHTKG